MSGRRIIRGAGAGPSSEDYADQNERDYDALVQAEQAGRITVERGL